MSVSDRPDHLARETREAGAAPQPGDPRAARDHRLAALLAATAGGDAGAFEAFYEATFAYARTVARRLVRDDAAVEDLLADCYFEAWRAAGRFDPARGSAVTWLLTRVRSRGIDALRSDAARPDRRAAEPHGHGRGRGEGSGHAGPAESADDDAAEALVAAGHGGPPADPADLLWRRQAGAALQAALATLSTAERWVLGLAYLRELSQAEIAQATGMPLGTVKSHAQRAQHKLRSALAATNHGTRGTPGNSGAVAVTAGMAAPPRAAPESSR